MIRIRFFLEIILISFFYFSSIDAHEKPGIVRNFDLMVKKSSGYFIGKINSSSIIDAENKNIHRGMIISDKENSNAIYKIDVYDARGVYKSDLDKMKSRDICYTGPAGAEIGGIYVFLYVKNYINQSLNKYTECKDNFYKSTDDQILTAFKIGKVNDEDYVILDYNKFFFDNFKTQKSVTFLGRRSSKDEAEYSVNPSENKESKENQITQIVTLKEFVSSLSNGK